MDAAEQKLAILLDRSMWDHLDSFSDEALASNPDTAFAWATKGCVRLRHDQVEQARQLFLTALQVDPSEPLSRTGLAMCHYRDGDIDQAVRGFRDLLDELPNSPRLHSQLCRIYYKAEMFNEAKAATSHALSLFPVNEELLVTELLLARRDGNPDLIRRLSNSLLQHFPENQVAHLSLGTFCLDAGDFDQAEEHFQTCLRIAPSEATARLLALVEAKRTGRGSLRLSWWYLKRKLWQLLHPRQWQRERRNIKWDR